jgi:Phage head completion protein (GPL)
MSAISDIIDNDGFWPDIALHAIAAALALEHMPKARLERGVLDAMIEVNSLLQPFKQRSRAKGYITLEQIPPPSTEPALDLRTLYRRALYCQVGAALCPRWSRHCRVTSVDHRRSRDKAVYLLLRQT